MSTASQLWAVFASIKTKNMTECCRLVAHLTFVGALFRNACIKLNVYCVFIYLLALYCDAGLWILESKSQIVWMHCFLSSYNPRLWNLASEDLINRWRPSKIIRKPWKNILFVYNKNLPQSGNVSWLWLSVLSTDWCLLFFYKRKRMLLTSGP